MKINSLIKFLLVTLISTFYYSDVLSKDIKNETTNFIKIFNTSFNKIIDNEIDNNQKKIDISDLIEHYFDIKGIGLYSLGDYRKNLKKSEIRAYNKSFKKYFTTSLGRRLYNITKNIRYQSTKILNDKYIIVETSTILNDKETKVEWRVYSKNPKKLEIRDLIINNFSLVRTQKAEFQEIMTKNNFNIEELITYLDNLND